MSEISKNISELDNGKWGLNYRISYEDLHLMPRYNLERELIDCNMSNIEDAEREELGELLGAGNCKVLKTKKYAENKEETILAAHSREISRLNRKNGRGTIPQRRR